MSLTLCLTCDESTGSCYALKDRTGPECVCKLREEHTSMPF